MSEGVATNKISLIKSVTAAKFVVFFKAFETQNLTG